MHKHVAKKACSALQILALFLSVLAPATASATTVTTSLSFSLGAARVDATWAMATDRDIAGKYLAADDDVRTYPQFNPSGQVGVAKPYALCALVTDPDGAADIGPVSGALSYPAGVAAGGVCAPTQSLPGFTALSAADSFDLFCGRIQDHNSNLFYAESGFALGDVCHETTGSIRTGKAVVYCAESDLAYDAPAGDYYFQINARDGRTGENYALTSLLQYQALTGFETDFNHINYGLVGLGVPSPVYGDSLWDAGAAAPTLRNSGNTRLSMTLNQDDMGLGSAASFSFRSGDDGWTAITVNTTNYFPAYLSLAASEALDFSVTVDTVPALVKADYTGTLTLSAQQAPHAICS